ncbi:type II secretion system minor pseudopilin GspK [Dryocola sp. BD626]|uniref:type II secretion system minor pseudopilin GspK n=1 Tax=Dryocola sp. BD626 TaxID=3133273 RepID=UPI003F4FD193
MNLRHKGVALVVVMMLIAIMAALAAEMTVGFRINLRRTDYQQMQQQHWWYLNLAETKALDVLKQDLLDNPKTLTLKQYWAQKAELPLEGDKKVRWQLYDGQACFNVNALASLPADSLEKRPMIAEVFETLIKLAGNETGRAEAITDSIADYIDADNKPRRFGAEDEFYRTAQPPRMTANQRLFAISELKQVNGITPKIYQALASQVCALPSDSLQININTLTEKQAPLLSALFLEKLSVEDAAGILAKRPTTGWSTVEAFMQQVEKAFPVKADETAGIKAMLSTNSQFFNLESRVTENEQASALQSRIYFDSRTSEAVIYSRRFVMASE